MYRDDDPSDQPNDRAVAALRRVANALGDPVEAFFQEVAPTDAIGDASELLRLWSELLDPEARQRILAQLRSEVDRHR